MPERPHHPEVGDLTLSREKLPIYGTNGQLLVIYHAEPRTTGGDGLALLGALSRSGTATMHDPATDSQPGVRPADPGGPGAKPQD